MNRKREARVKKDKAPRRFRNKKPVVRKKGLIIVYTGEGKGKSTAAFGMALRALGQGMKVAIVQFIKGSWKTGEEKAFEAFSDAMDFYSMGEGFTWDTKNYARDVRAAEKAWEKFREVLFSDEYDLVIFDEINCCFAYNFLDVKQVMACLLEKPAMKHIILTGRGAPRALMKMADLVTEMKSLKHPYDRGISAQKGIEF